MFLGRKNKGFELSKNRYIRKYFGMGFSILTFLVFVGVFIPYGRDPDGVQAITDLTEDATITFTTANALAEVSIMPTGAGSFATTSGNGDIRFSVTTDNYTGYNLAIRGTKTTIDDNTNNFNALESAVTAEQFAATANTQLNNRWGYKPNLYDSAANSNYYGLTTSNATLDTTSAPNSTAKSYTLSLGARADIQMPSGTYVNQNVVLECTANVVPTSSLTVNYGDHVTGVTIAGTSIPDGEVVTLTQGATYAISMTTEQGFTVADWDFSTGTVSSATSTSTNYTVSTSDTITLTAGASFDGPSIQNLSSSDCTTTARMVQDTRDDQLYKIKRLSDGNCWMMENLNLGATALTTDLTSSNTNLTTTITAATFNGWKQTTGVVNLNGGAYIPITGTDSVSANKYGTLYNYYAASAGTIGGMNISYDAVNDICPAGWRMPTGGSNGEYANLYTYYNSYNLMRASEANNGAAFSLSGAFLNSDPEAQDENGIYWTSTYANNSRWGETQEELTMSELYLTEPTTEPIVISDPTVYTDDIDGRYLGVSVRCIMRKPTHTLTVNYGTGVSNVTVNGVSVANGGTVTLEEGVTHPIKAFFEPYYDFTSWSATSGTLGSTSERFTSYKIGANNATLTINAATFTGEEMQDLDPAVCTTNETRVKDTRDGRIYTIKRFNDGNCWMVDNLSLGATAIATDLTSTNTNISTTVTASTFNGWRASTPSSNYSGGVVVPNEGLDHYTSTLNGVLYNYYAASGSTISGSSVSTNATYDICPAGWKLPSGGSGSDYERLVNSYSTYRIHAPTSLGGAAFGLAGYSTGTTITNKDAYGYYWSSTRSAATSMRYLSTAPQGTSYTYGANRRYSASIKCILDQKVITDLTYFQDFKNLTSDEQYEVLSSMSYNTTYELVDNRDNKTYQVAKLKDGNIWMTENLDLGRTTLSTDLTTTNTNLATGTITATSFNNWIKSFGTSNYLAAELIPLTTSNTSNNQDTDTTSGTAYGTLYNYCAASAGTICDSTSSNNAASDICPAGWRLPTGSNSGEFKALYDLTDYNTNAKMRAPIADGGAAFALAGSFSNSTPTGQGGGGVYWSSTWYYSSNMHHLSLNPSSVGAIGYGLRSNGYSVRCIMKKPTHTLTVSYGTGVSSVQVNGTTISNGSTISLEEDAAYSITMSAETGYSFSSWSATSGTIGSTNTQSTTYTISTSNATLTASASVNYYTCTKKYRLQNADSTYPSSYTTSGSEQVAYGSTCNYSQSMTDYVTQSTSGVMNSTSGITLYLELPRNTYTLTINKNATYISSVTGAGTYRWGQQVSISATASSGNEFTSWSQTSGTTGTFGSTTSASTTFTMGKGAATIYANGQASGPTISSLTYMQDFRNLSASDKTSVKNSMSYNTAYNLIDNRDNKSYAIAKLKDGNVWMAENLDLGRTTLTTDLTSSNTNLSTTISASTFNGWEKTSGYGSYIDGEFSKVFGTDATSNTAYGTVYNYCATSAGTICTEINSSNASYDICPAGWRLPTGGSSGEFQALYTQYSSYALMRAPIADGGAAFALAGTFYDYLCNQGTDGIYWSSTRKDDLFMYRLYINTSSAYPADDYDRYRRYSVRCVLK